MARTLLTWLSVLTTTVLLAACCGSVACQCNDAYADAIGFHFSTDTVGNRPRPGFFSADIDTVYVVRVPLDTAQRPRADTALVARSRRQAVQQPLVINNTTPFTQAGNRKLDQYRYTLYLAARRRARPSFLYRIDTVQLKTVLRADGCCTCYQNTNKLVTGRANNQAPQQLNLTDPDGNNQLVPIELRR